MTGHLITGIGRTATKWLAKSLGWPHEPKEFDRFAVSPRHLHLAANGQWLIPDDVKVSIVTRYAEDQMLSIINRWYSLGNALARRASWLDQLPGYLLILDTLASGRATIMRYEELTASHSCLMDELARGGVECSRVPVWSTKKLNVHPKTFTKLPRWGEKTAATLQERYDRWHRDLVTT